MIHQTTFRLSWHEVIHNEMPGTLYIMWTPNNHVYHSIWWMISSKSASRKYNKLQAYAYNIHIPHKKTDRATCNSIYSNNTTCNQEIEDVIFFSYRVQHCLYYNSQILITDRLKVPKRKILQLSKYKST